jgi:phosphoribosylanthranilate isomerase
MTFVKFCGITDVATAALGPLGGAVGFVTGVPDSPRNLDPDALRALVRAVPDGVEAWAVVRSPRPAFVHRLFEDAGVDRVQVHGDPPFGLGAEDRARIVPVVQVPASATPSAMRVDPPEPRLARSPIVLDAATPDGRGGHGLRPDWGQCATLVSAHPQRPFVLAGGLDPDNVQEALARVRPWGVDVSTGIESSPGVKDHQRMARFLAAVVAFERADA